MRTVKSLSKFLIIVAILSLTAYFSPVFGVSDEWKTALSVTAFLFSILTGFSITILWNRLTNVRLALNEETGNEEAVLFMSKAFGDKVMGQLTDLLDRYVIETLINPLQKYDKSQEFFLRMYMYILHIKAKPGEQAKIKLQMLDLLNKVFITRAKTVFFSRTMLIGYLRYTIYLLGAVLISLLFLNKTASIASILVTALLSSVIVLLLILLAELNKMRLWEKIFLETNVRSTFDVIGRKRFYEPHLMQEGIMRPEPGERYRTLENNKIVEKTWPKEDRWAFLYRQLV